jgi:hypothetical protein
MVHTTDCDWSMNCIFLHYLATNIYIACIEQYRRTDTHATTGLFNFRYVIILPSPMYFADKILAICDIWTKSEAKTNCLWWQVVWGMVVWGLHVMYVPLKNLPATNSTSISQPPFRVEVSMGRCNYFLRL